MFFGFLSEFLLDFNSVAGDVFAALTEEEPSENANGTTEDEERNFGR